jgi:hypothetical protein
MSAMAADARGHHSRAPCPAQATPCLCPQLQPARWIGCGRLAAILMGLIGLPSLGLAADYTPGQRVRASSTVEVRAMPSTTTTTIAATLQPNLQGTQPAGALGSVVGGPKLADGNTWWNIDYDSGVDGWSTDPQLQAAAPDTTPPAVPSGLQAVAASARQINLSWTRSADDVAAGVVHHEVLRNGSRIAVTASTNYQDTGLSPNTSYRYTVQARDAAGNRSAVSAAVQLSTPSQPATSPLDAIPVGTWYAVPNSQLSNVEYRWPPGVLSGTGPPRYLTESSGAYDSKRQRFVIWGGGHNDYAGNELYSFDMATLAWRRDTEPSLLTDRKSTIEASGYYATPHGDIDTSQPRSRHTYDTVEYVANIDRFCGFGMFAGYPASKGAPRTDCFDFDARRWEQRADIVVAGLSIVAMTAYDPASGHVFFLRGAAPLTEYDPLANTWTRRSAPDAGYFYDSTAIVDTKRHRFVAMGGGHLIWYDIRSGATSVQQRVAHLVQGERDILRARRPGFVYDAANDVYVAWSGEMADSDGNGTLDFQLPPENVYVIDPDTWVARKVAPSPANTVKPRSPFPLSNGFSNSTFGRFAYLPSHNLFILVNNWPSEPVYVYRLDPAAARGTISLPPSGPLPSSGFDFRIRPPSGTQSAMAGGSMSVPLALELLGGSTQAVALSTGTLPDGVTAAYSAASCAPPCNSTLTLQLAGDVLAGVHPITVAASGAGLSRTASFDVRVEQPAASAPASAPTATATGTAGGGCTLGHGGPGDGTLPLLVLAAWAALRARKRCPPTRAG